MWKIAAEMKGKIPDAYNLSYMECVQLNEKWSSGEPDSKYDAMLTAFRYGFALAQRMEANKRKKGVVA